MVDATVGTWTYPPSIPYITFVHGENCPCHLKHIKVYLSIISNVDLTIYLTVRLYFLQVIEALLEHLLFIPKSIKKTYIINVATATAVNVVV